MTSRTEDLPSFNGEWKGYYEQSGSRHGMKTFLLFNDNGEIMGEGIDTVGRYTIEGKVEANSSFAFTKQYIGAHSVIYSGTVQWGVLPTLQGQWQLESMTDNFLLHPDKYLQQFNGPWKGYYQQLGSNHEMKLSLTFGQSGAIGGQGTDDIGTYTISGNVQENHGFKFTKQYVGAYSVFYTGTTLWGKLPTLKGKWQLQSSADEFVLLPEQCIQAFGGEWQGYYEQSDSKHEMLSFFNFSQGGIISGNGKDDIGSFVVSGKVETNDRFDFTKKYIGKHSVAYTGTIKWGDSPTLEGEWKLEGQSDKFMFVPVMA